MATDIIQFKRGSTFGASVTYTASEGSPPDLTGLTITSDIRDSAGKLYSCTVVVTSSTTFTVSFSDTSNWHLGSAYWDIRFSDGIIFFSETAVLNIVNNVTVA